MDSGRSAARASVRLVPTSIEGFHGTAAERAKRIVDEGFLAWPRQGQWLGKGAYFFQDAPALAWEWAEWVVRKFPATGTRPAVIWATLDVQDCLDLFDIRWYSRVKRAYEIFRADCERRGVEPPQQEEWKPGEGKKHYLDYVILNDMIEKMDERGVPFTSVRGIFWEGYPAFPKSHLHDQAHVAIAARTKEIIKVNRCFLSRDKLLMYAYRSSLKEK